MMGTVRTNYLVCYRPALELAVHELLSEPCISARHCEVREPEEYQGHETSAISL